MVICELASRFWLVGFWLEDGVFVKMSLSIGTKGDGKGCMKESAELVLKGRTLS